MSLIHEVIVTTINRAGDVHIAPMGIREQDGFTTIAPFRPSKTLENLQQTKAAVVNLTDDVRIFAGCLTGKHDWPTCAATKVKGVILAQALAHREFEVNEFIDDETRPKFLCREVYRKTHAPFSGFNRAQGAVIEAAVLVSRLHMLPKEKIDSEIEYLKISIEKTAGPREQEAWRWLMGSIVKFRDERT